MHTRRQGAVGDRGSLLVIGRCSLQQGEPLVLCRCLTQYGEPLGARLTLDRPGELLGAWPKLNSIGGASWCSTNAQVTRGAFGAQPKLNLLRGASWCSADAHKLIGGAVSVLGRCSQVDRGSSFGAWPTLVITGGASRWPTFR